MEKDNHTIGVDLASGESKTIGVIFSNDEFEIINNSLLAEFCEANKLHQHDKQARIRRVIEKLRYAIHHKQVKAPDRFHPGNRTIREDLDAVEKVPAEVINNWPGTARPMLPEENLCKSADTMCHS